MASLTTINAGDKLLDQDAFCGWLRGLGIEPTETYRVDLGHKHIIAHRFALNEQGRKYLDGSGSAATLEPLSLPVPAPPPGT